MFNFQELMLSGYILCYGPLALIIFGFIAFALLTDKNARSTYLRRLDPRPEAQRVDEGPVTVTRPMRVVTPSGASACSSIFAAPWHKKNSVFALGDGGGRSFNQVATSDMFVSIPRHHFKYIIELVENFWFDRDKMREVIMPSHAPAPQKEVQGG